jgi:hypothetical protein
MPYRRECADDDNVGYAPTADPICGIDVLIQNLPNSGVGNRTTYIGNDKDGVNSGEVSMGGFNTGLVDIMETFGCYTG